MKNITTLGGAYELFMGQALLGLSGETLSWYSRKLGSLVETLGPDLLLNELTAGELLTWRRELENRDTRYSKGESTRPEVQGGLSPWTLRGHIRAARRFTKWCKRSGLIDNEFLEVLKLPRLPRHGRKGASDGDIKLILQEAMTGGSEHAERDYALLAFLAVTGCRRGGVANLRLADLNLDADDARLRRRVTVREKGDKERAVFLTAEGVRALEAWLRVRPKVKGDAVFLAKSPGQSWHPIKPAGVSAILRRYADRLGIQGQVNPHSWRHWRARKWLEDGLDLSQVSQLLGHEDVSTTVSFYGIFSPGSLQEAYDKVMREESLQESNMAHSVNKQTEESRNAN